MKRLRVQISEKRTGLPYELPFSLRMMEPFTDFNPADWTGWVQEHEGEDIHNLALRYAGKLLPLQALLAQVKGRQTARIKLPTWYAHPTIWYPDTLITEQSSSEAAALLKAEKLKGQRVADLTGGLGVDSQAFSRYASSVFYSEPDRRRCEAARWNFNELQCGNIHIMQADAETILETGLVQGLDTIYLDPSRRNVGGKKVFLLSDLQPDILLLKERLLQQSENVIIKLSPMMDIKDLLRLLPDTVAIDIIAWRRECRELVVHLGKGKKTPRIQCHHAGSGESTFAYSFEEEEQCTMTLSEPREWLYEPNAAVRKSGAWKTLCKHYGVSALHPNTHLFTSSAELSGFPGRKFRLLDVLPYRKDTLKEKLKGRAVQQVFYNFPEEAGTVIKRMNLASGEPFYLFYVTTKQGSPGILMAECMSRHGQLEG